MANALAHATSPYLLQHKDNPVAWREWSAETLAEAKRENKPILLSVGYAACHWCHVMAHESFENPEIAELMNRHFISVKVDREERPDIDTIYQQALALLGQHGGWPLTMFLTPDGEPFWGGTYFPPDSRYGRPGFADVLKQVAEIWQSGQDKIEGNRQALRQALEKLSRPEAGDDLGLDAALGTARELVEEFDAVHGGIGGAPKFPQAPMLSLVWQAGQLSGDGLFKHRVLHTLSRICQGGIYDHLGGGFARYSVDAYWLVPHFEKMLYDNAQLLALLGEAYAETGDRLYFERARETVGWLTREMMTPAGLASSLDADSEGEEGRYYVWEKGEIQRLLGEEAGDFCFAYGVTRRGNWEGKNILNRLHESGLREPEEEKKLAELRRILFQAREERVRPERDDKVLADWNGLAIQGLVGAAERFGEPEWADLAADIFDRVVAHMAEGDRLHHSWRDGRWLEKNFLDDYAQMIRAAVLLHQLRGDPRFLDHARRWSETVEREFKDPAGGYALVPQSADDLIVRAKNAHDGPHPSAVGSLALAWAELGHLTGERELEDRARGIVRAFSGEAKRNPYVHSTLLLAASFMAEPLQIVVAGDPEDATVRSLAETAHAAASPLRVVQQVSADSDLADGHPAKGKEAADGPAAYVCRGPTCLPPVSEPGALRELLVDRGKAMA